MQMQLRRCVPSSFGVAMLIEGASFVIGSISHVPVQIPLGFAVIDEPKILPATVVEGICAIALFAGGYAVLAGLESGWKAAISAHLVAIAGVLLGIVALALGRGPRTQLNDIYHATILTMLVAGVLILVRNRDKWRREG